jgi:hypothetical protein|eukprot:COSAG06_NODE_3563_length_5181_cov_4.446281_3_plen_59_part_00
MKTIILPRQARDKHKELLGKKRRLYRISTKGEPCVALPREDDEAWLAEHIAGSWRTQL